MLISAYSTFLLFKSHLNYIKNKIVNDLKVQASDHTYCDKNFKTLTESLADINRDIVDIRYYQRVLSESNTGNLFNEEASKILLFIVDKYINQLVIKLILNNNKIEYLDDVMTSEVETISYRIIYVLKTFKLLSNDCQMSEFFDGNTAKMFFENIANDLINDLKHYKNIDEKRFNNYSNFRIKQINHAFSLFLTNKKLNLSTQITDKTFNINIFK